MDDNNNNIVVNTHLSDRSYAVRTSVALNTGMRRLGQDENGESNDGGLLSKYVPESLSLEIQTYSFITAM